MDETYAVIYDSDATVRGTAFTSLAACKAISNRVKPIVLTPSFHSLMDVIERICNEHCELVIVNPRNGDSIKPIVSAAYSAGKRILADDLVAQSQRRDYCDRAANLLNAQYEALIRTYNAQVAYEKNVLSGKTVDEMRVAYDLLKKSTENATKIRMELIPMIKTASNLGETSTESIEFITGKSSVFTKQVQYALNDSLEACKTFESESHVHLSKIAGYDDLYEEKSITINIKALVNKDAIA